MAGKVYVTVTQTRVPSCFLLIPGFNIPWQLTYFLTNIFHHKMGCILASPPNRFLESSLAVGPERNGVRNIVENGERRKAKWVSPWESPECQNRTPASAFLHLSFRLDPIICKYCNYCRAERRALHKWAWVLSSGKYIYSTALFQNLICCCDIYYLNPLYTK